MIKKILAFLISSIMAIVCISFNANAKVIEPEVVKTEKWTTSYYIDDDIDTLYPYIQCEADIYNDGTIKLYMWNTHEWDGFATVSHKITLTCSDTVSDSSLVYSEKYGGVDFVLIYGEPRESESISPAYYRYKDKGSVDHNKRLDKSVLDSYDISYISASYDGVYVGGYPSIFGSGGQTEFILSLQTAIGSYGEVISHTTYRLPLPKMSYRDSRPEDYTWILSPREDPTGTYNFRLFGHDITITPELLSENIVSEPVLTEQEQYIKQLEEENKKLKAQLNLLSGSSCGDIDGDGDISVEDAQLLLQYYTESKVARLTDKPIKDWYTEKYG